MRKQENMKKEEEESIESVKVLNDIKLLRIKANKAHNKCGSLQSELSSFTKYESVKKVKQIEEHLEILNQNLNSTIEDLKNCSKELNRKNCSRTIEEHMGQYQELIRDLSQAGIMFMSEPNFRSMIEDYEKICETNDVKLKDIFKPLYEATKSIEYKTNEFMTTIDDGLKSIEHFTAEQNRKLKELDKKSVQDSTNIEKKLYIDILARITDRISELNSIKHIIKGKAASTTQSQSLNQTSVIMYNISEDNGGEDDISKVKNILHQANLETKLDIQVNRLESSKKCRPLKVTFDKPQIAEKLLQLPNKTIFSCGMNVEIVRYTK